MTSFLRKTLVWAGWIKPRVRDLVGVQPLAPSSIWRLEFNALQAWMGNAGLAVSDIRFDEIKWYLCDEIPVWVMQAAMPLNAAHYHPKTQFAGVWLAKDKAIAIVRGNATDDRLIRHEMTHALAKNGAPHTKEYFRPEWGNYTGEQPL